MRIAIPYEQGAVCQHFGHAPQFKLYDLNQQGQLVESLVVDTEASGHAAIAEFLAARKVQAVLCGGIGSGALMALASLGIDVLPGVSGPADEVIAALLNGSLEPAAACGCGCGHHHGASCGCSHDEHADHDCGCGNHGCC